MNEHEPALELFRKACGLYAPLTLEFGESGQSTQTFDCPFVLIGRDSRSDLVLDDSEVSRRHAFLQAIEEGRIYVVDLNSRTKVSWEGQETPCSQGWLDSDRFIQLGPFRIRRAQSDTGQEHLSELPHQATLSDEAQIGEGDLPRAGLELPIRMGESASLWPLNRPLILVGRSDLCQLVVTDESISKFHAALVRTAVGVWVVDLRAREGVHVNGTRVRWAWLADGDKLRFGRLTFVLRYDVAPDRLSREVVPLEAGASPPEQPGTALAVRRGNPGDRPGILAIRPEERLPTRRKPVSSQRMGEPVALVPSHGGPWEPAMQYAPHPTVMWQQQMQMMESFHNDMILMVQMFVAMHREHLASVHDELGKVEHLTRELSDLQARLAQPSRSGALRLPGDASASAKIRRSLQAQHGNKQQRNSVSEQPKNDGGRPKKQPPKPEDGPDARRPRSRSAKESASAESDETVAVGDSEMHAVLTTRIAELQRERQGYWQRILSALHN